MHVVARRALGTTLVAASTKFATTENEKTTSENEKKELKIAILERQIQGQPLTLINPTDLREDLSQPSMKLVLFGETHDDARAQFLENELYSGLTLTGRKWALALEFIERDKEDEVERYLTDETSPRKCFTSEADAKRYSGLLETAKHSGNSVVAANAPRRLVSRVTKGGPMSLDAMPEEERRFLPPLPYRWAKPISQAYESRLHRFFWGGGTKCDEDEATTQKKETRRQNLVAAQCLWDATMAHSVLDSLLPSSKNDAVFLVCGRFHVEYYLGIVDHIEHLLEHDHKFAPMTMERNEFRLVVAVPLPAADFDKQEQAQWSAVRHDPRVRTLADFVIFTRED